MNHANQTQDVYTSCLGAQGSRNGAVIVIGISVVANQIEGDWECKVFAWGLP